LREDNATRPWRKLAGRRLAVGEWPSIRPNSPHLLISARTNGSICTFWPEKMKFLSSANISRNTAATSLRFLAADPSAVASGERTGLYARLFSLFGFRFPPRGTG
jgi:hypothetical protein